MEIKELIEKIKKHSEYLARDKSRKVVDRGKEVVVLSIDKYGDRNDYAATFDEALEGEYSTTPLADYIRLCSEEIEYYVGEESLSDSDIENISLQAESLLDVYKSIQKDGLEIDNIDNFMVVSYEYTTVVMTAVEAVYDHLKETAPKELYVFALPLDDEDINLIIEDGLADRFLDVY